MEHFKTYINNLISNSPLITIPIVTCFGYLFAYQYEIGSAKYYYIPEYLVHIELLQVIFYAAVIYAVIFAFGLLFYIIFSDLPSFLTRLKPSQANRTNRDIIVSRLLAALLVLSFLLVIPGILGEHLTSDKKSYIIFQKDNKDYAIVKIYGDSVIALALNEKSRALTRDILILPKDQLINGTVKYFDNIKEGK
jgi:hypothetical protein